jgi:glycosyltransferase involved in cell wall biosynthesis
LTSSNKLPRVFMMDLWATVPYYTAYLSKALRQDKLPVSVGSITYYLDPKCFSSRGIKVDPGLMDVVGRFRLPKLPRRLLKFPEAMLNLTALTVRFAFAPPDVIHVQYLPMLKWRLPLDLWFLKFCRSRGSKIVLTVHDLLPHDTGERYKQTFHRLYAMVDAIICHSGSIRTRLANEFAVPVEEVSVIPHGPFFYDLPAGSASQAADIVAIPPDQLPVLWQGIIFPYKGIDLLLEAWQQVEAACQNASLAIVGTGAPDLLKQIQTRVAELRLQRVHLAFRFVSTEELVALYRAAGIVVYPYRAITTSGALATGLALGKTIVATDLPVFRELLHNRENALLVPQDPAALAAAILELTHDPALRGRLAEAVSAMDYGDTSWSAIARDTITVYQRVCSNGPEQGH